jgi:hypothetical protein
MLDMKMLFRRPVFVASPEFTPGASVAQVAAILLLVISAACGRGAPGGVVSARIEASPDQLRAVAPDGRVVGFVPLLDSRSISPEGEERIEKDYVLSAGPGAAWAGVYGYRYAGPEGGGWTERRRNRFTYYDDALRPLWSGDEVGGDPLGGDIRFGDSGRIVLIVNRTENLEDERHDSSSQPYIIARDAAGRVLFEKRGSSSGNYAGGVAISKSGKFLVFGENESDSLIVVDLMSGRTGSTASPPQGSTWEAVMLAIEDDGTVRGVVQKSGGEEAWEGSPQW